MRSPDPSLEELLAELESYLPPLPEETSVLGFAVPLELASADGDLRLITTITSFTTAADAMLAELQARGVPARRRTHRHSAAPPMGATIDDARAIAATLIRSYQAPLATR